MLLDWHLYCYLSFLFCYWELSSLKNFKFLLVIFIDIHKDFLSLCRICLKYFCNIFLMFIFLAGLILMHMKIIIENTFHGTITLMAVLVLTLLLQQFQLPLQLLPHSMIDLIMTPGDDQCHHLMPL